MKKLSMLCTLFLFVVTGCGVVQQNETRERRLDHPPGPRETVDREVNPQRLLQVKSGDETQSKRDHAMMKRGIETLGFIDPSAPKVAAEDIYKTADHLTYVSFFNYRVKSDGSLVHLNDLTPLQATRQKQAIPMMVITNLGEDNYSPEVAHTLFTTPKMADRLADNVIKVMKDKGYRALNIDFEFIQETDQKLYNDFLGKFIPKVKKEGYTVSTDLAPKTSDEQKGPWAGAHDYAFHGQVADFVVLMTYDWAWNTGPPMPVAPIPEMRKVLDYAVTKIPKEKIMLGFPLYGYDWILPYKEGNPPARLVTPQRAARIAQQKAAKIHFDNQDECPFFYYLDAKGRKHMVWFENEQSAQAKFNLVKEYGIRGIAYWALGREFDRNWSLLHENFNILKYGPTQ
ncbi:glycosyl hydrolase family 18 protein [Hazenella coriacea]|uniref:Spore germination protein n=1 Tax=Hazenella coriacea TaxID=1179467 RepID=A0A4R3L3S2_9BACL|nr:glycosyl hydrolase family 18 protein [Hazenella coriacea]TCS93578.1 spore germination protein [Hazenella coriacea]